MRPTIYSPSESCLTSHRILPQYKRTDPKEGRIHSSILKYQVQFAIPVTNEIDLTGRSKDKELPFVLPSIILGGVDMRWRSEANQNLVQELKARHVCSLAVGET